MKLATFEEVVRVLDEADVRFILVGEVLESRRRELGLPVRDAAGRRGE